MCSHFSSSKAGWLGHYIDMHNSGVLSMVLLPLCLPLPFSVTLPGTPRGIAVAMSGYQACGHQFIINRMAWSLYRRAQFRSSINGASAIMLIPSLLCEPHRDPPSHSGYMPGFQACVPKFFKSRMAWSLYRRAQFRSSINGASAIMFIPSLLCDPHIDPPGSQACVPKFFKSRMAWSLYRRAQFRSSINGASAIMFTPSLLCDPHKDPPWHSGYMPGSQACIPKFFIYFEEQM